MSSTNDSNDDNHWLSSGSGSIADMVAEASRSFVTNEMLPGFVYNQEYDVYYNATTGYYFDLKTSLYYHPSTRLYYSYDSETGAYNTFQHPNVQQLKWKSKRSLKRAERLFGREYVDSLPNEYADICDLLFEVIDKVDTIYGEKQTRKRAFAERNRVFDWELNDYVQVNRLEISSDRSSDEFEDDGEMQRRLAEEEANKHPPCIRLIEETSRNRLHIITIDGGLIGFGSKCDISIGRADGVAEKHAQFLYNTDDASNSYYTIEPLNNGFPFYYNEHEIKKKMIVVLQHLDRLRIGPHAFAIHLHKGTNTCNSCEPGVLNSGNQASSNIGEPRRTHRQEMRAMKAKFGVYELNDSTTKHRDRAAERREVFGSEPSIPKRRPQPQFAQVAAVQQPQPSTSVEIKSDNVGFRLLKNMGWQDGSGLGAKNQGINAPIETRIKAEARQSGMSDSKGVFENRFRYMILVLGWICLSCIASNMNIYNMTRLCMSGTKVTGMSLSILTITLFLNSTHGFQVNYTERDHNQLIMAAAFGTIIAVFPYNYAYTRFGARYVFLIAGTVSSISTALIPVAVRLGWGWTYATRFVQLCSSSFGWESVFYLHSVVTAILMVLWFLFYKDRPCKSSFVTAAELEKINRHKGHTIDFNVEVPYRAITTDPFVYCILFNGFAEIFSGIFCVTYQPLYMKNVLNFDIQETAFLAIAGPIFHIPLKLLFGYSSDKIKFLSEKSKLIICNSIAVFFPGISYLALAFLPVDRPWLHVAQFSVIGITFAAAGGGFYKSANLYSRQFSHVIIGSLQFTKGATLFLGPLLMNIFVQDVTEHSQWAKIYVILAISVFIANIWFCLIVTDKPAEFTKLETKRANE
ncbi:hypothetical protein M3Y96_00747500 [Aphelenchoides besseyi]|nr:hypothetical protein M3Y96_00747500 [Aphelenchoides besseyi]